MAFILKDGKKLTHPTKNIELDFVYQVIDKVDINKRTKELFITYYTYEKDEYKTNINNSFMHDRLKVGEEDYDKYFLPYVNDNANDLFACAYTWLYTQEWESKRNRDGSFTITKWNELFRSDE